MRVESAHASANLLAKLLEFYDSQKQEQRKKVQKKIEQMQSKMNSENKKQTLEKIAKLRAEVEKDDTDWLKRNWPTSFDKRVRNCFYFGTNLDVTELASSTGKENEVSAVDGAGLQPKGLFVLQQFLTEADEQKLLERVYQDKFENLSMRRVQNFGFRFIFGPNLVRKTKPIQPIPEEYKAALRRLQQDLLPEVFSGSNEWPPNQDFFDQLTITEYKPGEGAPSFIESHKTFEEPIAILSLRSDCVMSFRNEISGEVVEVVVPRLSLVVLSGEMRFLHSQGVPSRKIDKTETGLLFRKHRLTFTFRKTKAEIGCKCHAQQVCDDSSFKAHDADPLGILTQGKTQESLGPNEKILQFEKEHVEDVYNNIAEHFSHTRYKPWPKVFEFLSKLPKESLVGDIGCGNGKYMFCGTGHHFVGVDVAVNFARICKKKDFSSQVVVADSSMLPLRSGVLDHAISIAVIHHFVSHGKQLSADNRREETACHRGTGQSGPGGRKRVGVRVGPGAGEEVRDAGRTRRVGFVAQPIQIRQEAQVEGTGRGDSHRQPEEKDG